MPIQYADFAHWQRGWLQGEVLAAQLAYWREALAEMPTMLELPTDRPRPREQTFNGAVVSLEVPAELTGQLKVIEPARAGDAVYDAAGRLPESAVPA